MSHIKETTGHHEVTRNKVMDMLQMTEERYGTFVMEQALAYLEKQLGANAMSGELKLNGLFWAWWRNHWHDADVAFIDEAEGLTIKERQLYYEIAHDPELFEYTPQRAIYTDAFNTIKRKQQLQKTT